MSSSGLILRSGALQGGFALRISLCRGSMTSLVCVASVLLLNLSNCASRGESPVGWFSVSCLLLGFLVVLTFGVRVVAG